MPHSEGKKRPVNKSIQNTCSGSLLPIRKDLIFTDNSHHNPDMKTHPWDPYPYVGKTHTHTHRGATIRPYLGTSCC